MTGWATTKRLVRTLRDRFGYADLGALLLTLVASVLSTAATFIIFEERFFDGAWMYLVILPVFYVAFGYFRRKLTPPRSVEDRLRTVLNSAPATSFGARLPERFYNLRSILVALDGTNAAEASLAVALRFARAYRAWVIRQGPYHLEPRRRRAR